MFRPLLLVACPLILLFGCGSDSVEPIAARAEPLLEEMRTWKCRLQSLHTSSVALWDSVTIALNQELPPVMSANEKRNVLAVRNSDLIQMFEIYPQLDTGIQRLVETAGARDSTYAAEMRRVHDSLEIRETRMRALLAEMEQADPAAYQSWRPRLDSLACE